MSDRPAPPAQPPAPPRTPPQGRPPQPAHDRGTEPAKAPVTPAAPATSPGASPAAEPTTGQPAGPGDTAVRVGLAERIQAKLVAATSSDREGKEPKGKDAGASSDGTVVPATAPSKKPRPRGPRRARLRLTRIDPWSVMKTSFLLSIAFGIVTVVAVAMIWEVIGAAGVWDSINDTVKEVIDEPGTADFDIEDYVGTDRVLGFTMLVAAVDVVLITAIATLGAFLYNMSAALLGGVEVTLAEDN
ncbi:DUF3566 domain-containing protein [Nocardioides sp.]|uniref:DUF3566 domain-containing protein n=1 Tax=Nocardioides sp. TaxID=35761 RepID=UPI00271A94AE|nr:DUF3566 domain-containing protein [Nocardioides sp.]MDO9458224.1 DUF3566 domain-containing protein [Nocardioides sp.]